MRILAAVIALVLAGLGYWYFFHTPTVLKRHTKETLRAFSDTVESKDRAKISEHLKTLLAENAITHLEVGLLSITQQNNAPVLKRDFSKLEFVPFVDNILYPLTDFGHRATLEDFVLSNDAQTAAVTFSSKEWGDGTSYYAGTGIQMRYSSDTVCNANVRFVDKQPVIEGISCAMGLRSVPKPGEAQKIQQNPEVMRGVLR